jgi:hypothetical protein
MGYGIWDMGYRISDFTSRVTPTSISVISTIAAITAITAITAISAIATHCGGDYGCDEKS